MRAPNSPNDYARGYDVTGLDQQQHLDHRRRLHGHG